MDLQEFLTLERQQLQKDRERLFPSHTEKCPAAILMQTKDYKPVQCHRNHHHNHHHCKDEQSNELSIESPLSSLATDNQNVNEELHLDLSQLQEQETDEEEEDKRLPNVLPKSAKEFVNQRELLVGSARPYKSPNASLEERNLESGRPLSENRLPIRRRTTDDMEQWVTDTFYSYFPGFNNENQKRQNYLRERQRENQQNFLKHQMLHPPATKYHREHQQQRLGQANKQQGSQQASTATAAADAAATEPRSSQSTTTSTSNQSTTDKTDLELIVNNNPNYVPPKNIRPGTTRHKLIQDLGHVELSNIVTGNGIMERNMRSAELETARKKDYQRDLMQQIEEKRRSIEMLREKERRQEEALTRRLEAQLKSMQLEEQLEKERVRIEKARIESERNRLMREQLLSKLEQDAQFLKANNSNSNSNSKKQESSNNLADTSSRSKDESNTNKVYKYFSNSAHHEYRRGQPLPPAVELDFELPPQMSKIERECFHLCDKICPMCDEPLKSYESCCLRCQRKLALTLKKKQDNQSNVESKERKPTDDDDDDDDDDENDYVNNEVDDANHKCRSSSYALVCVKCERLYAMCTECLAKSDVCRACQRERNVCMNCRRNLCSFCLEEIACGRDTERSHINEKDTEAAATNTDDNAFRVLELNYSVPAAKDTTSSTLPDQSNPTISPPYSINIARNSIFHADYKPTPVKPSFQQQLSTVSGSVNTSLEVDSADEHAMERIRRQTDQRLSRYLKNYGDLASNQRSKSESRHRGTQTTPQTIGRRDVVLREAVAPHNLSMPLLREMPKMTRKETGMTLTSNNQRKIDHLKKRWEVPAVQKFTVSSTSPKILTQVGAIRKQLQAARFYDDAEPDDHDY
ncbi:uncharacterized protein Dwil_GK14847 [Drosophila willistoni]|uniref:Uncharacterized protein n=1 Tax=Drosophila willistoni TaxID=7260 RepID=B4MWF9_DROWI|nr:uncharacterized protein Dwil_GK14847 [Drosophila willistoni]